MEFIILIYVEVIENTCREATQYYYWNYKEFKVK